MDTLVAVVIAEDIDREEGWQYTGALLYDLKVPNPGPQQHVPFDSERIRSIEQLHDLSIPGRISDSSWSAGQLPAINRETNMQGSTDDAGINDMVPRLWEPRSRHAHQR